MQIRQKSPSNSLDLSEKTPKLRNKVGINNQSRSSKVYSFSESAKTGKLIERENPKMEIILIQFADLIAESAEPTGI